ncbi:DMT family transporter [Seohaeicola saemankumensis]|nr:DMT family transporter [Seohaeicola saemankumensis]MCA0873213.1 DMT family transporter [Seohaeicola saemankumensis]
MTSGTGRAGLLVILVCLGAGWGITQPLAKIAVSEGYRHFGLIFWQLVISGALLAAITVVRGKRLSLQPRHLWLYLVIAQVGTVLPNAASYEAARHLPAGVLSVSIATVPMFAFPMALMMGNDHFQWSRLFGVVFGLIGVGLLIGPEASLPERAMVAFIPLALVAPAFYGFEGNYVARWGTGGLDPIQVLLGASVVGAALALPLAVFSGQWIDPRPPWGLPDLALIASSCVHALVYATYVWMVGRAGPVFASLVSYLVTGFGVMWSMALLGERYSGYFWAAVVMMVLGMFLVQPRRSETVARAGIAGKSERWTDSQALK